MSTMKNETLKHIFFILNQHNFQKKKKTIKITFREHNKATLSAPVFATTNFLLFILLFWKFDLQKFNAHTTTRAPCHTHTRSTYIYILNKSTYVCNRAAGSSNRRSGVEATARLKIFFETERPTTTSYLRTHVCTVSVCLCECVCVRACNRLYVWVAYLWRLSVFPRELPRRLDRPISGPPPAAVRPLVPVAPRRNPNRCPLDRAPNAGAAGAEAGNERDFGPGKRLKTHLGFQCRTLFVANLCLQFGQKTRFLGLYVRYIVALGHINVIYRQQISFSGSSWAKNSKFRKYNHFVF